MARNQPKNAQVKFHSHQAERRSGTGVKLYCGGGCCCCCCCLHTLGGLIGAAGVSAKEAGGPGRHGIGVYWFFFLLISGLSGVFLPPIFNATNEFEILILLVLVIIPAVQLACSIVAGIWVHLRGGKYLPDKRASLQTIGKITLWSFLGAVVGAVAMVLISLTSK